ncbi:ABC transporter ATP-binding protein [Lactobacillus sp. ESL0791]|uniref:ABC transporter ATP-binding protein n=1 Tax=Lactobacillus sp. ESL0791 TaxID=2983234 RepID=UPI0023F74761|nr:ABC transporter ATP-binding protein [Lactobacillus sp. ESL0791]MDF7638413.1 ABC transporter ATP-binding protein [Lactobacillus sp. ESL0791]
MLLQTKNLTKKYHDKTVVNGVNLQIRQGSFTTLLGTNGAGKSSLINMLVGISTPSSGTINLQPYTKIGVVFQNSVLDNELTVKENLLIRAHQYPKFDPKLISLLGTQLGLEKFINQRYGRLSGGQKRRVDIARALLNKPDILFLDEPTTGLDVQTRTAIWKLLLQLQEKENLTILLTTHYLEEASRADFTYILNSGKIVASGTTKEIVAANAQNELRLSGNFAKLEATLNERQISFKKEKAALVLTPKSAAAAVNILLLVNENLSDFSYSPGSLETAFMNITGWEMK